MQAYLSPRVAGVPSYVASEANDAAVSALMSSGFTREQAQQIIASAKKSPEEVARQEAKKAAGYVATAANEEAKARLVSAGFTPAEAERIVAGGKDVDTVLSTLESVGRARLNEVVVKQLQDQGLSPAVAEALAATGGDPKKLLEIAKDPKKVEALVNDIDARLKKEGIDLGQRIKDGFGIADSDMKTAQTVYKAASAAYDVFQGVEALMGTVPSQYIAARWDETLVNSDASFAELARTLQSMSEQSEATREQRTAQYKAGARKVAAGVATAAAFIPVAGPVIAVAVGVVQAGLEALGVYEAKGDDNAPQFRAKAEEFSKRIWKEWMLVPPSFDSEYFTLSSYGDACQSMYDLLEKAEAEHPWKAAFFDVLFKSNYQVLGQESPLIDDLVSLGWVPFTITDWMGGANMVAGSHWNAGSGCTSSGFGDTSDIPSGIVVGDKIGVVESVTGGPSGPSWPSSLNCALFLDTVINSKTATPMGLAAMRASSGFNKPPFYYQMTDEYGDRWEVSRAFGRNEYLQNHICDRMAGALATLMAVAYSVPVEPLVQAGVLASRDAIKNYGWQPKNFARRLRDTFLAIVAVAGTQKTIKAISVAKIPELSSEVSSSALGIIRSAGEEIADRKSREAATATELAENAASAVSPLTSIKIPSFF